LVQGFTIKGLAIEGFTFKGLMLKGLRTLPLRVFTEDLPADFFAIIPVY
jgi:hypothetical protein